MKRFTFLAIIANFVFCWSAQAAQIETVTLSNAFFSRTVTGADGVLRTTRIENLAAKTAWNPENASEFKLRVSKGTQFVDGDEVLTNADFVCTKAEQYQLDGEAGAGAAFTLENKDRGLIVTVRYELKDADFFLRKRLEIQSQTPITLE